MKIIHFCIDAFMIIPPDFPSPPILPWEPFLGPMSINPELLLIYHRFVVSFSSLRSSLSMTFFPPQRFTRWGLPYSLHIYYVDWERTIPGSFLFSAEKKHAPEGAPEESVILLKYKDGTYSNDASADAGAESRSPSLSLESDIREMDAFRLPNRS